MELRPIDRNQPVVDQGFKPLQNLQVFCDQVRKLPTILGDGTPNGSVSASSGRFYLSQTASPALYVKTVDAIGGDNTLGWMMASGSYYISEQRFQDFTDQEPSGLDIPTVVTYGAAVTSPNGMISMTSGGVFEILKTGPYLIKSNLRVSRTGSGGVSHMHLWVEASADGITFAPLNVSIRIVVDNGATDGHLFDSSPAFFTAGTFIRTMQARSSTGVDYGGLYAAFPSASLTTYGVGPDPSASIEWHSVAGYQYE